MVAFRVLLSNIIDSRRYSNFRSYFSISTCVGSIRLLYLLFGGRDKCTCVRWIPAIRIRQVDPSHSHHYRRVMHELRCLLIKRQQTLVTCNSLLKPSLENSRSRRNSKLAAIGRAQLPIKSDIPSLVDGMVTILAQKQAIMFNLVLSDRLSDRICHPSRVAGRGGLTW